MDEVAVYVTRGDDADKNAKESLGSASSIQSASHYASFRNAECARNGAALSGYGPGERLFVASPSKPLISVYAWGKESADQRFSVPEQISCLALAQYPHVSKDSLHKSEADENTINKENCYFEKPVYSSPWLLAGGTKTGRLYIWELALGDLICVKDAHYQEISSISFSDCGTFLVTGGLDTRVHVWDTLSLVTPFLLTTCKPFAIYNVHSLPVTQVEIYSSFMVSDYKVYSSSKDGTVCIYDIMSKSVLTTFVFPCPVETFTREPAARAFYAGLSDGSIRQVPLYVVNPHSQVLEAVGGSGKVVTVAADPNLLSTFVHHVSAQSRTLLESKIKDKPVSESSYPTVMQLSMDGMQLISGDSFGQTFVADVITKQVLKAFTPCKSPIAYLSVSVCDKSSLLSQGFCEKKHRLLPPLKRVLTSMDSSKHSFTMQLPRRLEPDEDFALWLERKSWEAMEILGVTNAGNTSNSVDGSNDLQVKLDKVSTAYNDLKEQYEQLMLSQGL